jgi:hypothetical protein
MDKDAENPQNPPLPPRKDRKESATTERLAVETEGALTPEKLRDLRDKLGTNFRIRSSNPAINSILEATADSAVTDDVSREYDKVYDRTSPGYDRVYDRG